MWAEDAFMSISEAHLLPWTWLGFIAWSTFLPHPAALIHIFINVPGCSGPYSWTLCACYSELQHCLCTVGFQLRTCLCSSTALEPYSSNRSRLRLEGSSSVVYPSTVLLLLIMTAVRRMADACLAYLPRSAHVSRKYEHINLHAVLCKYYVMTYCFCRSQVSPVQQNISNIWSMELWNWWQDQRFCKKKDTHRSLSGTCGKV